MNLVPQFGFLELILIAVIALIVVGPRDLPRMMRQAGRMVAKARSMAAEFTSAFDQMARETEMDELRKEIDALKRDNPIAQAKRELDETVKPISDDLSNEAAAIKNDQSATPSGDQTAVAAADSDPSANEPAAKS